MILITMMMMTTTTTTEVRVSYIVEKSTSMETSGKSDLVLEGIPLSTMRKRKMNMTKWLLAEKMLVNAFT
ncbi:hypothetical protein ES332_A03G182500v1 [Gossypium tomentosum]|uniref:Uncharacterized protein n=1 Tax=Gossypium tomentosum TaxID=34277 RepID=A0A5D2R8H8_GOSTO|nr:hypothetical protein ES332_A03G182500v1 [Gossypium tomentosum]